MSCQIKNSNRTWKCEDKIRLKRDRKLQISGGLPSEKALGLSFMAPRGKNEVSLANSSSSFSKYLFLREVFSGL